jgi:hypothetical protein
LRTGSSGCPFVSRWPTILTISSSSLSSLDEPPRPSPKPSFDEEKVYAVAYGAVAASRHSVTVYAPPLQVHFHWRSHAECNGISLRGGSALGGALKCVRNCVLGCGGKLSQDVHPPRCTSASVAAQIATEYRCEGRRRGRRRKVAAWPQGSRALGGAPIGVRSCVQGCVGEPSQKGVLCW